MLCPKCKKDTLKVWRTYDSAYLPFRQVVYICGREQCNFKGFYTLSRDKEEYSLKNHELYKRAYVQLCNILGHVAQELQDGENYLNKCHQLSFELAQNTTDPEKLEEYE